MNNFLGIIIILLLLIIAILLGLVIFVALYLLKKQKDLKNTSIQTALIKQDIFCKHHEKEESVALCAICEEGFCEKCIKEHEKLHFCPEHYNIFLENSWSEIASVKTTPQQPEKGVYLYNFKGAIWTSENIPAYIMTHYKINVDDDSIESHVKLYVREQDSSTLAERLGQEKQNDLQ